MSGPLCCTTTREGHRQRSSSGCQCAAGAGGSIGYARTTVTERRGRDSLRRHHAFLSESCICSWAANRRSEEHTSELQSRLHLVCRLLLEKKNLMNNVVC